MSIDSQPQIVRLEKALKLAEQWVNNMSKVEEEEEPKVPEPEGRPSKLGLGAKKVPHPKVGPLNDVMERKLHAKLAAAKRKAAENAEECSPARQNGRNDDDDNEDELESRTSVFAKKRVGPVPSSVHVKKKQK